VVIFEMGGFGHEKSRTNRWIGSSGESPFSSTFPLLKSWCGGFTLPVELMAVGEAAEKKDLEVENACKMCSSRRNPN
jgi:hypothetical protein